MLHMSYLFAIMYHNMQKLNKAVLKIDVIYMFWHCIFLCFPCSHIVILIWNWYFVIDIMSLTPSVITYIHLYYSLLLPITYMLYTSCYFHVTLVLLPVTYMLLSATYMLLPHLNVSE